MPRGDVLGTRVNFDCAAPSNIYVEPLFSRDSAQRMQDGLRHAGAATALTPTASTSILSTLRCTSSSMAQGEPGALWRRGTRHRPCDDCGTTSPRKERAAGLSHQTAAARHWCHGACLKNVLLRVARQSGSRLALPLGVTSVDQATNCCSGQCHLHLFNAIRLKVDVANTVVAP